MEKRRYYIPLFLIPLIDQIGKLFAQESLSNPGLMLGYMASLSIFSKSVLLASGFLIMLVIYIYAMTLLSKEVKFLRIFSSVFVGGAFSNCLDRMLFQYVRDHLTLFGDYFFNLADVAMWISGPLVIFFLFFYRKQVWHEDCLRRSFVVVSKSHRLITWHIMGIFIATLIVFMLFHLSFLRFLNVGSSAMQTYVALSLLFGFCTFILSSLFIFIYAQRIVGPLQALKRHLLEKQIKPSSLNIRLGDPLVELKEISVIINAMENDL
jgi:lipoprotein signal peptidase